MKKYCPLIRSQDGKPCHLCGVDCTWYDETQGGAGCALAIITKMMEEKTMQNNEAIIAKMNELMSGATEEELRLLLITAHGVLGK